MKMESRYQEGDIIWRLNKTTNKAEQSVIKGIMWKRIGGVMSVMYAIEKDCNRGYSDLLWITERNVHRTKDALLKTL